MNTTITKIQAEEIARKIRDINVAYLAGYITKAERDRAILLLGV